jgi:hypothetical protein
LHKKLDQESDRKPVKIEISDLIEERISDDYYLIEESEVETFKTPENTRNARYSVLREIMNTNEKVGHKSKQYSYIFLILFAQEIFCRNSRLEIVS